MDSRAMVNDCRNQVVLDVIVVLWLYVYMCLRASCSCAASLVECSTCVCCRFQKLENGHDGRDAAVDLALQLASLDIK